MTPLPSAFSILPFAPDPHLLQHISADTYDLRAFVLTTVFLLFADDVCLVAPQTQLLHDLWQHIRVLHDAMFHRVPDFRPRRTFTRSATCAALHLVFGTFLHPLPTLRCTTSPLAFEAQPLSSSPDLLGNFLAQGDRKLSKTSSPSGLSYFVSSVCFALPCTFLACAFPTS